MIRSSAKLLPLVVVLLVLLVLLVVVLLLVVLLLLLLLLLVLVVLLVLLVLLLHRARSREHPSHLHSTFTLPRQVPGITTHPHLFTT
jgi:membrane protein implicated in regulation of membrane protease activity